MSAGASLEDEYRKNKELKEEEFQNLKDWYSLQAHLPPINDALLSHLFHSCWFKMEPTKVTADNYFTIRTRATDLFSGRDPMTVNLRNDDPVVDYFFLTKKTPENYRVCMLRPKNTDPPAFVFSESSKSFLMHHDLELYLTGSSPGDIIVFDMEGISLGHLARLNLVSAKHLLQYMQEAIPIRLINIHFINVVPFIDKIMALLRPFMSKEFVEKLMFHTEGIHTLFEFVPQEIMPKDYGGGDKSVAELSAERLGLIQKFKSWFEYEEKRRVDESKRTGKSKLDSDFGVQGSFKKLDFD